MKILLQVCVIVSQNTAQKCSKGCAARVVFPLSANHIVDLSCCCRLRLYFSMWLIVSGIFFHATQHLNTSCEKSDETERLKQLMSENSSLKQKTFELQNQLQGLLEKLKNDKEKVRKF